MCSVDENGLNQAVIEKFMPRPFTIRTFYTDRLSVYITYTKV